MAIEQRASRVDRVGQRVDRSEELRPIGREGHRQQDSRKERRRKADPVHQRGQRIRAAKSQPAAQDNGASAGPISTSNPSTAATPAASIVNPSAMASTVRTTGWAKGIVVSRRDRP